MIDDSKTIEIFLNERITHHLNQAQVTPFKIEPLILLIGTDSLTSFTQTLFNSNANLD